MTSHLVVVFMVFSLMVRCCYLPACRQNLGSPAAQDPAAHPHQLHPHQLPHLPQGREEASQVGNHACSCIWACSPVADLCSRPPIAALHSWFDASPPYIALPDTLLLHRYAVYAKSYGAGVALILNKTATEYPGKSKSCSLLPRRVMKSSRRTSP
jgi:hypothetical protein